MKKASWVLIFILVIMTFGFAGDAAKGNVDRGRVYFRQTCKDCHSKGGVGGQITPLDKTVAQWRSYFEAGKHGHGKLSQVIKEEHLLDVRTFLMAHAADSEQPETCGR